MNRLLNSLISMAFLASCVMPVRVYAQSVDLLPVPGVMVNLSPAFEPVLIKGLKVHPDNPFLFDFIIDSGNSTLSIDGAAFKDESNKLIKYFLSALTVPEKDLWVNLSPYEKDRMIAKNLGQTQMGQDMLAQDYLLKQLTASMIYPEKGLGKEFWDKVYDQVNAQSAASPITMDAFNKVWIVADRADVYEGKDTAFVTNAHLKVMLEQDYLATKKNLTTKLVNSEITQTLKQIVLPAIEKEVNEGKNFAQLRQMYHSMILASWYKMRLKDALISQVYGNQSKVSATINANNPKDKEAIFKRYIQAYKKGVFNFIKEDIDPKTYQPVPRKYFSGGLNINAAGVIQTYKTTSNNVKPTGNFAMATVFSKLSGVSPFVKSLEENLDLRDKQSPKIKVARTVLIVEPDLRLLNIIEKEIQEWGYKAIAVPELTETMKKTLVMEKVLVDMVITGQDGDDGKAVAAFARQRWEHSDIVLIHDKDDEDFSGLFGGDENEGFDRVIHRDRFEYNKAEIKKDIRALLRPRILLVSQGSIYTRVQMDILIKEGYDVIYSDDRTIDNKLRNMRFDAILTDEPLVINTLPNEPKHEGSGHKILKDLAAKYPQIPVLYRWPVNDPELNGIHPNLFPFEVDVSFLRAAKQFMPVDAAQVVKQKISRVINFVINGAGVLDLEKFKINGVEPVLATSFADLKSKVPAKVNHEDLMVVFIVSDISSFLVLHSVKNFLVGLHASYMIVRADQQNVYLYDQRKHVIKRFEGNSAYFEAQEYYQRESVNYAMNTPETTGGIDFNTGSLNILKQGQGVVMQFDQRVIDQIKASDFAGIDFYIQRITPISNLRNILGA